VQDFSQNGEQQIILDYFSKHPEANRYCVDAGAFDGEHGSNSRALLLSGWGGVLIEPDPRTFSRANNLYLDRNDIVCVRRALSTKRGLTRMMFSEGPPGTPEDIQWQYAQVNSLKKSFTSHYETVHNYKYRKAFVFITTLERVLKKVDAPVDIGFMSIDCEAMDLDIVKTMNFSRYRPQLLCVECDDHWLGQFESILNPQGFHVIGRTIANAFFERAKT